MCVLHTIQIQQITVSEFKEIISETVRNEVLKLIPKVPTNQKTDIYGTRKQVAKELKVSLVTLHEYTKNGDIKGYRIGGRVLYMWTEIFESLQVIQSIKYKRAE